jgi:hypothetical protein
VRIISQATEAKAKLTENGEEERKEDEVVVVGCCSWFGIIFFVFLPIFYFLTEPFTAQGSSFPVHKKRYIFLNIIRRFMIHDFTTEQLNLLVHSFVNLHNLLY